MCIPQHTTHPQIQQQHNRTAWLLISVQVRMKYLTQSKELYLDITRCTESARQKKSSQGFDHQLTMLIGQISSPSKLHIPMMPKCCDL